MSKQKMKPYSAEFKERAVKLAIESDQPIAHTARDLGINENTLDTWISKFHSGGSQPQRVNAEHVYDELKRLKKENARLKEERDILKKRFTPPAGSCLDRNTGGGDTGRGVRTVAVCFLVIVIPLKNVAQGELRT